MRIQPARVALGAVGLGIGVVAVLALREATLSTHEVVARGSREAVELRARTEGGETNQTLEEMVGALLTGCRLEVASDLVGPVVPAEAGRFRAVLTPALDPTNRRQLRGCLEDWTIDHLLVDDVSFWALPR